MGICQDPPSFGLAAAHYEIGYSNLVKFELQTKRYFLGRIHLGKAQHSQFAEAVSIVELDTTLRSTDAADVF